MGPLFSVLFLPLTTIILPFYVITNFADMTWGGRGSVSGAATVTNRTCIIMVVYVGMC